MKTLLTRHSILSFKNGQESLNRVVLPPMASQTATTKGFVTSDTLEHYKRLSLSGAGIQFVEYTAIHPTGRGEPNQLGNYHDGHVEGLSQLSKVIKDSGALSGIQLVHNGAKSSSNLTKWPLWGASSVPVPIKGKELEIPMKVSLEQVELLKDWYISAVKRAYSAGFDIVELHAAHGYGLNQWLSPITNKRRDRYGGSLHNRSRLLREIITTIKALYPDKILAVRLAAQDHHPGGLTLGETQVLTRILESLGLDLLDISSGIGGWRRPEGIRGQGYLVDDAKQIKKVTSLPVIGVGGIKEGEFIDHILEHSMVDFAAVGRAILESPMKWNQDVMKRIEERGERLCV
ncbi:MAG: NADH:flavin oxidoreductase [Halobacteriovoraceae bacterium]|nr:NADH:flavin oxidoreductase [Halobacteriovoraceae bacterium]